MDIKTENPRVDERPDPLKPLGVPVANGIAIPHGTQPADSLILPRFNNAKVSELTPSGKSIADCIPTHPVTGQPMLEEASGGAVYADIQGRLFAHAMHFSRGMIKVRAVLAPLARQITNSTGLMNGNYLLTSIRDWCRLDWVGGHLGRIVAPLIPGFNSGEVPANKAQYGNISQGPETPKTTTGD